MNRRLLLRNALGLGLGVGPLSRISALAAPAGKVRDTKNALHEVGPARPLVIYNNWSAYDELSDNIPLTEELAMKELNELIKLKKIGVQVDYHVMDAFWFDRTGGFRTWHKQRWPNGPDRWLKTCIEHNIKPGMWFSINDRIANGDDFFLDLIPEWKDSATTIPKALCLFKGGYLKHLSDTLQLWYDKGVRAFKFDFARFAAADEASHELYLDEEIIEMNKAAFANALKQFRKKNPDVLMTAYNGFGGDITNTYAPFKKTVEDRWLQVFDTLYCGDPRFSDVPMANIWRSQDLYSDHMVRQYERNGLPLSRIDNCGFMVGVAGTCYKRALNAWKGMHILQYARGGWVNIFHGNLELFNQQDAEWFARVQQLFLPLQEYGKTSTFGAIPGAALPYGFISTDAQGSVCTVVNPSQQFQDLALPETAGTAAALLFADGGFKPIIVDGRKIKLGPEQMAIVGFGEYEDARYNLGTDDTLNIPVAIEPVDAKLQSGVNSVTATFRAPGAKHIRIFAQQFGTDGFPHRSSGGPPPNGKAMDSILEINVVQNGKPLKVFKQYDKMIWSGLSWGAVAIDPANIKSTSPITVTCTSKEKMTLTIKANIFAYSQK